VQAQSAPSANDLQPVQVTAQRLPVDKAAGASASAQRSPLTENLDIASVYRPDLQALVDSIPPPPPPALAFAVQRGDTISGILGTSDPAATGRFMRENNLTSSTLFPGQSCHIPSGDFQPEDQALGLRLTCLELVMLWA
jgi:hypothetical protein